MRVFLNLVSIYVFMYQVVPRFVFKGAIRDPRVTNSDNCLSFYFSRNICILNFLYSFAAFRSCYTILIVMFINPLLPGKPLKGQRQTLQI